MTLSVVAIYDLPSKLTEPDVLRIQRLRAEGVGGASLAREYGVTTQNVWHIVTRRTWAHVPDEKGSPSGN